MELHEACYNGNAATLKQLLARNGDNAIDVHAGDRLPFEQACRSGDLACVKLLLGLTGARHINVHAENEAAFIAACGQGHTQVAELLLSLTGTRRIFPNVLRDTAFLRACQGGHTGVVRLLLSLTGKRRVDTVASGTMALEQAYNDNQVDIMKLLLSVEPPIWMPEQAGEEEGMWDGCGEVEGVRPSDDTLRAVLLWTAGDPIPADADTDFMFMLACRFGLAHLAKALLALRGAQRVDVHAEDDRALREAVKHGHLEVANMLRRLPEDRAPESGCIDIDDVYSAISAGNDKTLCIGLAETPMALVGDKSLEEREVVDGLRHACYEGKTQCVSALLAHWKMAMKASGRRKLNLNGGVWRDLCRGGSTDVLEHLAVQRSGSCVGLNIVSAEAAQLRLADFAANEAEVEYDFPEDRWEYSLAHGSGLSLASMCDHGDFVREILTLTNGALDLHAEDDLALRRASAAGARKAAAVLVQHGGGAWAQRVGAIQACLCLAWQERTKAATVELYRAAPVPLPLQYCLRSAAKCLPGLKIADTSHDTHHTVEPPLTGLVVQHILVWTLEKHLRGCAVSVSQCCEGGLSELFFFDVFALCTALPATRRSPEVTPLLQRAVMRTAAYQRLQWYGVRVPVGDIRGCADDVHLPGLLQRGGRRCMLLHRAATCTDVEPSPKQSRE